MLCRHKLPLHFVFSKLKSNRNCVPHNYGNSSAKKLICCPFSTNHEEPTIKKEWYADGKIARLILNNPSRRNPLSLSLMTNLHDELNELNENQKARAVILAAADGHVFSAGHDLKELTAASGSRQHKKVFGKCIEMMEIIQQIQLPVIAEVDGLVTAAGSQLVATCDIVVATHRSTFSCPGVKIGLFCNTPGIPMARNLPRKLLMDMLLTSRAITAQEALTAGLISRLVPDGHAQEEALKVAETICEYSRAVCGLGKAFFYNQVEQNIHRANRQGVAVMCENLKLRDAQEGISAFFGKRQPTWMHNHERAIKDE